MMSIKQNEKIIQNEMNKLRNNVILYLFTDLITKENGSKERKCLACSGVLAILESLANFSQGKLSFEEFSTEENPEMAKKYKVEKIPTILFLDENEKEIIRYLASPMGNELVPFMKIIQYYSGLHDFYKDTIQTNLKKISKSKIDLFITQTCPYCPTAVPIASLFAILSNGKISLRIIDINENPDFAMKYQVMGVPHTMINEKDHIYGMFTPQELMEKLTKGKQDFGGMYA
ncbi:MAG: thioredoxin family protein [Candidatus Hermodarchaeota archaeon]